MTVSSDQVTSKVRTIVGYYAPCATEEVGLDKTLDDFGLDSLDHVQLTMAVEEEFRIEILDDDADRHFTHTSTVQQIIDYVAKRVGAA